MTTYAQGRAELVAALVAAGVRATDDVAGLGAGPAALVLGGGVNPSGIGRGQTPAEYRVVLSAGAWSGTGAAASLAGLVSTYLSVVRGLTGWQVGEVGRDSTAQLGGSTLLAVVCTVSRMIDID